MRIALKIRLGECALIDPGNVRRGVGLKLLARHAWQGTVPGHTSMAESDRERWNARYRAEDYDFTPAAWVRAMEPALQAHAVGARALDLACGGGRNALYLAELGYAVDAWDISEVGLRLLWQEVGRRAIGGQPLPIELRQVELDRAPLPAAVYDLILDAHYLERALLSGMRFALRPGGRVIVHTFLSTLGGPITSRLSNPAYALEPGELHDAFRDFEILEISEDHATETAHLFARRPS
jgi:tellurite methyltransferase